MSLVIVTDRCFLKCKDIISLSLQERIPSEEENRHRTVSWHETLKNYLNRRRQKPEITIELIYIPEGGSAANGESSLTLELQDRSEAKKLFASMVKEVRDQHPDHLYLDDMVKRMLDGSESDVKTTIQF